MGTRGPRPTPQAILAARGSWRGKARAGGAASGAAPEPEMPARFAGDAGELLEEGEVWRRLITELRRLGVLSQTSAAPLERYCVAAVEWRKASDFVRAKGSVYYLKDAAGAIKCVVPFPQVAMARSLSAELLRLEQEMGMTPSARARVTADEPPVATVRPEPGGAPPVMRIAE